MSIEPARLRLMQQAATTAAEPTADPTAAERPVAPVGGLIADEGRLAHRATHLTRKKTPKPLSRAATENQVVGFVCDLLQAPPTAVGTIAAGLEASSLLVVRGAREARPRLRRPTMVLPESAHPAWFTAASSVGVTPVVVVVDADGTVPIGRLTTAITDDTVLVVASAPSYTHGTVDPVAWIAAATAGRGIPLHVDASAGGWALAYADLTGRVRQPWGFSVPGVSSITIDLGPDRGAASDLSVLLHRDAAERRLTQLAAISTRGSVEIASAWAPADARLTEVNQVLQGLGHERCAQLAVDALDATARLVEGLREGQGVSLLAEPDATTISLHADTGCDALVFVDALHHRGWTAHPVLTETGATVVRLPVTAAMLPGIDKCLAALEEASSDTLERGRAEVDPTLARLLHQLDPSDVSEYSAALLLDAAAVLDGSDDEQPERRSATNLLLRSAGPGIREILMTVHHDRESVPVRHGVPDLVEIHDEDLDEDDD